MARSNHTGNVRLAARNLFEFWETVRTSVMSIAREVTETWLSCLKQNRLNKHTNKQTNSLGAIRVYAFPYYPDADGELPSP